MKKLRESKTTAVTTPKVSNWRVMTEKKSPRRVPVRILSTQNLLTTGTPRFALLLHEAGDDEEVDGQQDNGSQAHEDQQRFVSSEEAGHRPSPGLCST